MSVPPVGFRRLLVEGGNLLCRALAVVRVPSSMHHSMPRVSSVVASTTLHAFISVHMPLMPAPYDLFKVTPNMASFEPLALRQYDVCCEDRRIWRILDARDRGSWYAG